MIETFIDYYWEITLGFIHLVLSLAVTQHAVLWKSDNGSVIGWVGLAWLSPIIGSLAYFMFGINRINRKAVSLERAKRLHHDTQSSTSPEQYQTEQQHFAETFPQLIGFTQLGKKLTQLDLLPGNSIEPLVNGDQTFPAMLTAIDNAQHSIALVSYIFDSDATGEKFLAALLRAQQRGVAVRVLIDGVGAAYSWPNMLRRLKRAGINARSFLPTLLPRIPRYTNLRNHRKILVCDGLIGFTGGTNIRHLHCLKQNIAKPTQCMHFKILGPVVRHLQETFCTDWAFASGETLSGDHWFPSAAKLALTAKNSLTESTDNIWARGISDGPDEDLGKMTEILHGAISQARQQIRIVTPYFLPTTELIQALAVASLRGVEVEILMPSVNNIKLVQWAACAQFWPLLNKGCKLYYTALPFDHSKLMVIDDSWSFIGSTNWDARSLRLNFEFNVECYSDQFSQQLHAIIDAKLTSASAITLDYLKQLNRIRRLRNGLARMLTPYL